MDADQDPLVTIEFNREVVWDDYLEEESFSIPVKAVVGENILHISTTNYPVILKKISYIFRWKKFSSSPFGVMLHMSKSPLKSPG